VFIHHLYDNAGATTDEQVARITTTQPTVTVPPGC